MLPYEPATLEALAKRLARIETRLVQLMLHVGMDPYSKMYEGTEYKPTKEDKA